MLINFLQKEVENIKSPEDFINGLQSALTMIAYGYPNMIDPTPGDMLEFQLGELKKELRDRYPDGWVSTEAEEIKYFVFNYIENMMGQAPEGVIDEMMGYLKYVESFEEMWAALREGYNKIYERFQNMESGGVGGKEMPDMGPIGEQFQEYGGIIVENLVNNLQDVINE